MSPGCQPQQTRPHACDQKDGQGHPHVLSEELFQAVLIRERKRSDRSGRPVVLLLLDVNHRPGADPSSIWEVAIEALAAAKRETDVVGWFKWWAVIGVILPEITASEGVNVLRRLDARIRRELAQRLDAETIGKISLRLRVYPEPTRPEGEGPRAVEPLLYPELQARRAQATIDDAIKRGLDVVGSLTILMVLAPLLLLTAILVRLSSRGPVLFRQTRIGHMMKPFTMLKFRTMHLGADQKIHHEFVSSFIRASGRANGQGDGPGYNGFFKLTNDSRVTAAGRILRKTSLDELPQLWNVLRGDMSLVGPRPPLLYELEQYKPWHRRRLLETKPGITGLWQVAGRSRTSFDEMVRLDLRYGRTRSLWTDIKILLATPVAVIVGKGAR